ncbi:hypothetical protein BRC83_09100 [Halobacteriales archaeon QS_1_68_17]|nr:MAG: hypothetical protein BRC83_09100 [Halobacteriales archaeon QS_1_68_17]
MSRYDLLLAFLPTLFVVALLVGHLLSVPPRTTLGVASVFGAFAVADGMFWNPPLSGVGRGDRDE